MSPSCSSSLFRYPPSRVTAPIVDRTRWVTLSIQSAPADVPPSCVQLCPAYRRSFRDRHEIGFCCTVRPSTTSHKQRSSSDNRPSSNRRAPRKDLIANNALSQRELITFVAFYCYGAQPLSERMSLFVLCGKGTDVLSPSPTLCIECRP